MVVGQVVNAFISYAGSVAFQYWNNKFVTFFRV